MIYINLLKYQLCYLEGAHESFINRHHTASVVKLSTIVRRRKQGNQLSLGKKFITIFYNLQEQVIVLEMDGEMN